MARLQLGPAPVNGLDAVTKDYVDSKTGASPTTINAQAANTWVRIARVTMAAQYDGVSADVGLVAGPDGVDTVNYAAVKLRAGQRTALGSNPAADIVLTRASTLTTADIGYVVVQNTPTSIVDFYIRIQAIGRQYSLKAFSAVNQNGVITYFNQDAGSTTTPAGLVNGSVSTDSVFFGTASLSNNKLTNVALPTTATDVATKGYVDTLDRSGIFVPPATTMWAEPFGIVTTTTTSALTSGRMHFIPMMIGPQGWTTDAVRVRTVTAQSGGAISLTAALYADDGTGFPDTSQRLAYTPSSFVMTSAGANLDQSLNTSVALVPGLYWLGILYLVTTTPTTSPTFTGLGSVNYALPYTNGTALGTRVKAYYNSYAALPTTATTKSATAFSIDGTNNIPLFALRRSA